MAFGGARAEDGAALSGQLAALASAQLPLGPGLRAMAAELRGRSLRKALVHLANRLDAGMSPAEALDATASLPAHLRGAMEAGLKTGRLGEVLTEYAAMERRRLELAACVRSSLRYPAILFFASASVVLLFLIFIVPGFARVFADFDLDTPPATRVVVWAAQHAFAGFLGLATLVLLGLVAVQLGARRRGFAGFWNRLPLLGRLWRCQDLSEFSRWMAMLVGQEVPLPEALRLTAAGLHAGYLGAAARRAAERLERGAPLMDSLRSERVFSPTLMMLVGPAAAGALADGFRSAADLFAHRAEAQAERLRWVALPFTVLVVLPLVGGMIMALFIPLIGLIQKLS